MIVITKTETLIQYENINVPFNTESFSTSQWSDYFVSKYMSDADQDVFTLYYLNLGADCRMPRIIISIVGDLDLSSEYITIKINDNKYSLTCHSPSTCLDTDDHLSSLIGLTADLMDSPLKLTFDPSAAVSYITISVTLHCWIPSLSLPKYNEMWIHLDQSLSTELYHHFSLRHIGTTLNDITNNDFYYYLTSTSEPCYNPKLTISTLDTDFDGTSDYLKIEIYANNIPNCYPDGNTCSNYHKCLDSYTLPMQAINNFIHIRISAVGMNFPCKFNATTFAFAVTNITLSCYVRKAPTKSPTHNPSYNPTVPPSIDPTPSPTNPPTNNPTPAPTSNPTKYPTNYPTKHPSPSPTYNPSPNPTPSPTRNPTPSPTNSPTNNPTWSPTLSTFNPSINPSQSPTDATKTPSLYPTHSPISTANPTKLPTNDPTVDTTRGNTLGNIEKQSTSTDTFSTGDIVIIVVVALVVLLIIVISSIALKIYLVKQKNKTNDERARNEPRNEESFHENEPLQDIQLSQQNISALHPALYNNDDHEPGVQPEGAIQKEQYYYI